MALIFFVFVLVHSFVLLSKETPTYFHYHLVRYTGVTKHIQIKYDGTKFGLAEPLTFVSLEVGSRCLLYFINLFIYLFIYLLYFLSFFGLSAILNPFFSIFPLLFTHITMLLSFSRNCANITRSSSCP